tara:strand:+ start:80294 stop:80959 length:666 start_codon:yes stop_codon:yes gene_type:complete
MFKFKKPKRDIRFLDPERLRHNSGLPSQNENRGFNIQERHANVNFVSEHVPDSSDPWVTVELTVEQSNESSNQGSFLKLISSGTMRPYSIKNDFKINDVESITLFDVETSVSTKKIGVFSDSKIYSALIHSLLEPYSLNVGHFNHPNTFVDEKFNEFDEISAWIIFLSDEDESDFLDNFLNRYEHKPALFLFPKMQRSNCNSRIKSFVLEHGFINEEVTNF